MDLRFPHARLRSIIPVDRLEAALRSAWLPLALLLLALSTVFVFGGDRGYFYRTTGFHNLMSSHHLSVAVNLSPEHGFQRFMRRFIEDDGTVGYAPYNRFPIGGYVSMKLATLPFSDNPSARLTAARVLMLLFFTATAVLAYLSLCRLTSNRWIALTAVLLSFSSPYLLYYNDMTANEGMPDFFGVMLTFHGMVVFVQEGRFRQLLIKTGIALLLGWHVFALLLPFVIFGLARELLRARSTADSPRLPTVWHRGKRVAAVLLRSRYLLLGVVALGFGLSLLTFNFTMEYVALDGETPLTELPSLQSMLRRTGVDSNVSPRIAAARSWSPFLQEQSQRILRMFIPYWLIARVGIIDNGRMYWKFREPIVVRITDPSFARLAAWLAGSPGIVLGVLLSAASLVGSIFVRPRILFATLASFGFFWALPMRNSTAEHAFETIYYIGLPLVFFLIVLLLVKRLTNRDGVIATASVIALLLFAVSSFQMSRVVADAETDQAVRRGEHDLLAIRELTAGEFFTLQMYRYHFVAWWAVGFAWEYYLNSSPINYAYIHAVEGRFVVTRQRIDIDALLTPQNEYFFLYDRDGLEAWYAATYRSVASSEPLAREEFNLYIDRNQLYYLKEPCVLADTHVRFFLQVTPEDLDDLPDDRGQYGFDNLDFAFHDHGMLFDNKCLAKSVLPQYAISSINTGRIGEAWNVVHYFQPPKLILESQRIASNEPATRSGEFDLYLDSGKLYYVKEPCTHADTTARFFLHVTPENIDDLPVSRKQYGFDNLDFDFNAHGVQFEGTCAASVNLPQYGITQITTGQFDGAWNVVHYFQPPKLILESQRIASNEPATRSGEFDLYLDSGKLYYVKEPCSSADTAARFFLHIIPEDVDDLPVSRKQYGFDNLDFDFNAHGVQFDGTCAARVDLPQYGIAGVSTGQFDRDGGIWEVGLELDARE